MSDVTREELDRWEKVGASVQIGQETYTRLIAAARRGLELEEDVAIAWSENARLNRVEARLKSLEAIIDKVGMSSVNEKPDVAFGMVKAVGAIKSLAYTAEEETS